MVDRDRMRDQIEAVLNNLLQEETIAGFSTTLSEDPASKPLAVRVFPRQGDNPEATRRAVMLRLEALDCEVEVKVDPLTELEEGQE